MQPLGKKASLVSILAPPVTKWMKGMEKRLRKKVKNISEFKVTEKDLQDVGKKRKN